MGPDPNASKAQTAMIVGVVSLVSSIAGIVLFWIGCSKLVELADWTSYVSGSASSAVTGFFVMLAISGILSLAGLVVGIIATITAVKYKKLSGNAPTPNKSKATAGMVCGIVAIILSALSILSCVSCVGCTACSGACASSAAQSSYSDIADILDSADSLYY